MANSRSGYAADIMPELLTADESSGKSLPVGTLKGAQQGRRRLSPVEMGQAAYKVVSADDAQKNMKLRTEGKLAPIKGGLDDANLPAEVKQSLRLGKKVTAKTKAKPKVEDDMQPVNDTDNYDPLGGEYPSEPGDARLEAEEKALAEPAVLARKLASESLERHAPIADRRPSQQDTFLAQRGRVTLELPDSTFGMPCIDVKECKVGITILLPMNDAGSTMVPKPGVEVTVRYRDRVWECFFPGTYFEIEELKLMGLVFVRKDG